MLKQLLLLEKRFTLWLLDIVIRRVHSFPYRSRSSHEEEADALRQLKTAQGLLKHGFQRDIEKL